MAEQAPVAAPERAPRKKAVSGAANARKPSSGPSVTELLTQAVSASKERSGVSLAALKKSLAASGYDVEKNNSRIKLGLKSLVTKGTLLQTKGTGASGSFKLNKKQAEAKDKAAAAKKKQQQQHGSAGAAAKSKKPAAKKPASAAKKVKKATVAKGTPKVKVTKPKKAAKSAAKASKPQAKAKPKASQREQRPPKK